MRTPVFLFIRNKLTGMESSFCAVYYMYDVLIEIRIETYLVT